MRRFGLYVIFIKLVFMMKIYTCTYRKYSPSAIQISRTRNSVAKGLNDFVNEYMNEDNFYDWGDDPSIYCSKIFKGKVTWGVCRPNVRQQLDTGDVIIFFHVNDRTYFYFGYGIVGSTITYRDLWGNPEFVLYRKYFNVIADQNLNHREYIFPNHENWYKRIQSSYVIFKRFRQNPLKVAVRHEGRTKETWFKKNKWLYDLIFQNHKRDSLRTSDTGFSHPHINLSNCIENKRDFLKQLP